MKKKIILRICTGNFEDFKNLLEFIKTLGYKEKDMSTVKARTDKRIIKFIEDRLDEYKFYTEEDSWGGDLFIDTVDMNKPWFIDVAKEDGLESITYLKLKNKKLNYYEVEYN